jgi:hypothetical protein
MMPAPFVPQFTERQNRSLKRIVESLTAAQTRTKTCYQHLRSSDRKDFQDQILVCPTTSSHPEPSATHPATFPAWAYNLSQGGIGFVALPVIGQYTVSVGIRVSDGSVRWLTGRVVRARAIPEEDFIDYGVAFQSLRTAPREGSQPAIYAD